MHWGLFAIPTVGEGRLEGVGVVAGALISVGAASESARVASTHSGDSRLVPVRLRDVPVSAALFFFLDFDFVVFEIRLGDGFRLGTVDGGVITCGPLLARGAVGSGAVGGGAVTRGPVDGGAVDGGAVDRGGGGMVCGTGRGGVDC